MAHKKLIKLSAIAFVVNAISQTNLVIDEFLKIATKKEMTANAKMIALTG